ncbi:nucleotide exchange factor GrpE [Paenarthrobacter aurescens]|uniref:Protein GrpE n=1 Tax=Paenarthrobacter aurescens (strain TC1) TaxID=290340 RepID=A1R5W4_PAEAT|nr:nucleotide exchange factor GrpE [Paenarthrobacter aurescens]ABM09222.1 co-chaperone GrpE [Paenarthrobacter aurescens TC1]
MSDHAGPAGHADPGSDGTETAAAGETETMPGASAEALAKMEDLWRRALADADNIRKRAAREASQLRAQERAAVSLLWLPVLDNLELALAHAPSAGDPLVDGLDAIRSQAIDILARLGYPRIDGENVPFDPRIHEVVSVSETDDVPPGTVITVLRPGYGGTDTILRPAAVVVSRAVTADRG